MMKLEDNLWCYTCGHKPTNSCLANNHSIGTK